MTPTGVWSHTQGVTQAVLGRDAEIGLLSSALAEVSSGGARTVVLSGSAGVGKSTLLDAIRRLASAQGATVLEGGCVGIADMDGPYAPFLEAFNALAPTTALGLRRRFEAWSESGSATAGAPYGRHADDTGRKGAERGSAPSPDPATVDPAQARRAQARALLAELATHETVLLCLDDVHWADRSSLALMVALARSLPPRVLMVLAARPGLDAETLGAGGESAFQALDHLRRRSGVSWCDVPTLPDDVISEIARAARARASAGGGASQVSEELPPARVAEITALAEGVALVAVELASADHGRRVPRSVSAVIGSLWRTLGPGAQEAVSAGAVMGTRFSLSDVAALLGRSPGPDLEQAAAHGLLRATRHGYEFGHVVDREAVLGRLAPHTRMALHHRYADLLEEQAGQLSAGAAATTLARASSHRVGAGDRAAVVVTATRACLAAADVGAYPEAFAQARAALSAWSSSQDPDARSELLLKAAEFASWAANPRAGLDLVRETLRDRRYAEQPLLWERRGQLAREIGDLEDAHRAYRRAEALIRPTPTRPAEVAIAARVWAGVAALRLTSYDLRGARVACAAGLALDGLPKPEHAGMLITSGVVEALTENPEHGLTLLRAGRRLARESGAEREVWRYVGNAMFVLQNLDRPTEALDLGLAEVERARNAGVAGSLAVLPVINNLASTLLTLGRWQEVIALTSEALASGPPVAPEASLHLARGEALLHRGDLIAAQVDVLRVHEALSALPPGLAVRAHRLQVDLSAASADLVSGRAAVEAALGLLDVAEDPGAAVDLLTAAAALEADSPPAVRDIPFWTAMTSC